MTGKPVKRHIALLVETSNAYARGILIGVNRYVTRHPAWSLYLAEHSRQETDFSWLEGWRGDGVLARIENQQTADFIRGLGLPTIDVSSARLAPEIPGVETDDEMIARWAVDHFVERGLRNFAFCGDERFGFSQTRGNWFAAMVRARGATPHGYTMTRTTSRAVARELLVHWLRSLPKPVGVFACYDIAGREVLEACKIAGIRVPDEVAVLGVDNDELMSNLTAPPLSSIEPDARRAGYLAAEMLDGMMSGSTPHEGLTLVGPVRTVTRQSTDILAVEDPLVAAALRFIRDNVDRNVGVDSVRREVGLSRRALDLRFVRDLGRTVHGEILRLRMARVAELLGSTDLTLQQIAERLDFAHSEYISVAFKKHTGRSPNDYRRAVAGRQVRTSELRA